MKQYLIIAQDDAPDDWYIAFQFRVNKIGTQWSDGRPMKPPRVVAKMTAEEADELMVSPVIKYVGCNEPISDEDISQRILAMYAENTESSNKVADGLLDLMVKIRRLEQKGITKQT